MMAAFVILFLKTEKVHVCFFAAHDDTGGQG